MSEVPMREQILSAAEERVRNVGYNAVSFRDLASDVGVKSSSVHYHFPQKEDLGLALLERYQENFKRGLDLINIDQLGPVKSLEAFMKLFSDALIVGDKICLCAMMGAEVNGLPPSLKSALNDFFDLCKQWLEPIHAKMRPTSTLMTPLEIVSALEGAMIVSTVKGSRTPFDMTASRIAASYRSSLH